MSKLPLDFSFERDGRPLAAWLIDLVDEESGPRLAAGEALQAMMFGHPSIHTDLDDIDWESGRDRLERQKDRFEGAVRAAAMTPDFPTLAFVRRLIIYRIILKRDWYDRVALAALRRHEANNPRGERLAARIREAPNDAARTEANRRFMRWICASTDRDHRRDQSIYEGAESMTAAGIMASAVFKALGDVILADPDGLRAMLADADLSREATALLNEIGPPAMAYAHLFLDRLDARAKSYDLDGSARALGSIARNDPSLIDEMLLRLRTGTLPVRIGAAEALERAGPPLAGRLEIALDLLQGATQVPELAFAATRALASVGRDREDALQRILELAAPQPPRPDPDGFDQAMAMRGVAIDSLRHFPRFADRAVPALIDALDTFEEYDPDWTYNGENERICSALSAFGPDAAPAIPRLLRHLDEWHGRPQGERSWPNDIISLLAAIGPAASAALPALERLRCAIEDEESPSPLDPDDPLDRLILALRGDPA